MSRRNQPSSPPFSIFAGQCWFTARGGERGQSAFAAQPKLGFGLGLGLGRVGIEASLGIGVTEEKRHYSTVLYCIGFDWAALHDFILPYQRAQRPFSYPPPFYYCTAQCFPNRKLTALFVWLLLRTGKGDAAALSDVSHILQHLKDIRPKRAIAVEQTWCVGVFACLCLSAHNSVWTGDKPGIR